VAHAEVAALQAAAADLKAALGRKEERLRSSMGALQRVSSSLRDSWVGGGGGAAAGVSRVCGWVGVARGEKRKFKRQAVGLAWGCTGSCQRKAREWQHITGRAANLLSPPTTHTLP
jgi:hypothetical protein